MIITTTDDINIIPSDKGISTQLWTISRYLQSISILISFRYINKKLNFNHTFFIYTILTLLSIYLVFNTNILPACTVEGQGLTNYKRYSEYLISLIVLISVIILKKNKNHFERNQYNLIFTSFVIDIITSIIFTTYASIEGNFNVLGQISKFLAYYLIYKAFIKSNLKNPYTSLNLVNKELNSKIEELKESNERYTKLVENTPNGILMQDDEKILYANEQALRILSSGAP